MHSCDPRSRYGMKAPTILLLAPLLLLSLACGSRSGRSADRGSADGASAEPNSEGPLKPEESRVLGVFVGPSSDFDRAIEGPDTVRAGETFTVTITTGGGGCERVGDEGVLLAERDAIVMVYDFTSANRPGVICTEELKALRHEVPLTFSKPGEAVIRVWGRKQTRTSPPYGEPTVIERRLVVR